MTMRIQVEVAILAIFLVAALGVNQPQPQPADTCIGDSDVCSLSLLQKSSSMKEAISNFGPCEFGQNDNYRTLKNAWGKYCYGKSFHSSGACSHGYEPKDTGACGWDTAYTCCRPEPAATTTTTTTATTEPEAPTEAPTMASTEAPTEAPTVASTEETTQASPSLEYIGKGACDDATGTAFKTYGYSDTNLAQCKSLCLQSEKCVALNYYAEHTQCRLGVAGDDSAPHSTYNYGPWQGPAQLPVTQADGNNNFDCWARQAPTEAPTMASTEAATEAQTEAPTMASTEACDENECIVNFPTCENGDSECKEKFEKKTLKQERKCKKDVCAGCGVCQTQ